MLDMLRLPLNLCLIRIGPDFQLGREVVLHQPPNGDSKGRPFMFGEGRI
jgi:hypothetical protein